MKIKNILNKYHFHSITKQILKMYSMRTLETENYILKEIIYLTISDCELIVPKIYSV